MQGFMTIAVGENYSLPMKPSEYIAELETNPEIMTIYQAIQRAARKWSVKGQPEVNVANGNRNPKANLSRK